MKVAFTFRKGQGGQAVGMGKALYDAFDVARAVFAEVDDGVGHGFTVPGYLRRCATIS